MMILTISFVSNGKFLERFRISCKLTKTFIYTYTLITCRNLKKTYRIVGIQQNFGYGRADVVDQQITYLVPVENLVSCNKGIQELNFKLIHSHRDVIFLSYVSLFHIP